MFENTLETSTTHELIQLHANTLMLMTQFSNGHHCPKLAHMIVNQLHRLVTETEMEQALEGRQIYLQLLKHWQHVTRSLIEARDNSRKAAVLH